MDQKLLKGAVWQQRKRDDTLRRRDVGSVQRIYDAGVIFTKRQVLYQVGHVDLQNHRRRSSFITELMSLVNETF